MSKISNIMSQKSYKTIINFQTVMLEKFSVKSKNEFIHWYECKDS